MPGVHSPDKEPIGVNASRKLVYRVKKAANRKGMDMAEFVVGLLEDHCGQVHLTREDMERIEEATRIAERTRRRIATRFIFRE